jgi:hypothetical protein
VLTGALDGVEAELPVLVGELPDEQALSAMTPITEKQSAALAERGTRPRAETDMLFSFSWLVAGRDNQATRKGRFA